MRRFVVACFACLIGWGLADRTPANAVDFSGQRITVVIGNEVGGGTDVAGRLLVPFFEKYLPGNPNVLVRNMPGASGIAAVNFVHQQTKRDGLTLMIGANSQLNPLIIAKAKGTYAPEKFQHVGGLGRGGTVLLVNTEAEKRLFDKRQPPLSYGVIVATRSAAQTAMWGIEYLGWNVKWIAGYRGSNETTMALERGEVDMTASGNLFLIQRLVGTGRFKILVQQGEPEDGRYVGRPDFGTTPILADLLTGKITDPMAKQAYAYWESVMAVDKWVALSEGTPDDIVAAYRAAFQTMVKDPEFLERGKKISEDLSPMSHVDMTRFVTQMAGVTEDTEKFINNLLRKQGVRVDD